jgi:ABC-type bacteriocin/lantibiotic exporter with double-glycine peptidase domain
LRAAAWCASVALIGMTGGVAVDALLSYYRHGMGFDAWLRRFSSPSPLITDGVSPVFRQTDQESCGVAALAITSTRLGEPMVESQIRHICGARPGAWSLDDLAQCAGLIGFSSEGLRGDWESLRRSRANIPTILHLRQKHFVVSLRVEANRAVVFDPAVGQSAVVDRATLERSWTGAMLVLNYRSPFEQFLQAYKKTG